MIRKQNTDDEWFKADPATLANRTWRKTKRFFAVFGGIRIQHRQPCGKVTASSKEDGMTFKVFTSFTLFKINDLSVYKSFTNYLHM
jgi:hypothetical protein